MLRPAQVARTFLLALLVIASPFSEVKSETLLVEVASRLPALTSSVMDEADLLSDSEQRQLKSAVEQFNRSHDTQMAVYVAKSLHGALIETVAISAAEKWKLGKKGEDRGLILVIAPKERKMRLEVGYGLEGSLTDFTSKRIIDEILTPSFQRGAYYQGILGALNAISKVIGGKEGIAFGGDSAVSAQGSQELKSSLSRQRKAKLGPMLKVWAFLIFGIVVLPWFFGLIFQERRVRGRGASRRMRTGRHIFWGGLGGGIGSGLGRGGGGFGGFSGGGGGFGGGGASGSW